MSEINHKLKKAYSTALIVFVVMIRNGSILPQDVSNGTIDFIFRPENNWTQFAIWVGDENGVCVRTVFITNFI